MAGTSQRLGKVQLEIMRVLWRRGRATAREITDDLTQGSEIAHSTVQTLLRKMETKGAVRHEVEERTFVFYPVYEETEITEAATRDLLSRLFGGSVYHMVAHLLRHESISPEEIERLRRLIDTEEKR